MQLLQVVRGGQFPELRTRPTLSALQRLVQAGLMPHLATKAFAGCAFSSQTAMLQRDHSTFGLSLNEADLPAKET